MATQLRTPPDVELTSTWYRELSPELEGFRLLSATVTVTLLDDANRARYEYECHLETTGDVPARYWCYHLPASVPEVTDVRAWDARGKLQPRVYSAEKRGSHLEIRLRDAVRRDERYSFGFGYESAIRPVVAGEARKRTVTYADWVIFNIPCALLQVHVELPRTAAPVMAVPACAEDEGGRVTYRVRALRALESVSFMVAYRRTRRPHSAAAMRSAGILAAAGFLGSGLRG